MATLLALVCLAVGVATTVELQHFLLGRLDAQLVATGGRLAQAAEHPRGDPPGGPGHGPGDPADAGSQFLLAPGQPPGTLGARVRNGGSAAGGVLAENGALQPLDADAAEVLASLPDDDRPRTVSLARLGDYRLLSARSPDGDVMITGLPLREVDDILYRLVAVETAVSGTALVAAVLLGALIVSRALRPLRRVAATATLVSSLPLERGEVALVDRVEESDTNLRTEVGRVGAALNRLLDHVGNALAARQASEMRVRQFVADASHELRTPLAVIRGYAELTRRGRDSLPADVARAMSRVESEAKRMTSLVEDLLLLARLDAGRPLAAEPVDLSRLIVEAVGDATVAGPHHTWRLDLPNEPVVVAGDPVRLHQVLASLLANARIHTPAGTVVTTGLVHQPRGQVAVTVTDDGPGIDPALLPQVFERFARGDSSRSRSGGSTGLGLAIVRAIVIASGGTVDVSSRPGHTAFVVRLPAQQTR